MKQFLSLVIVLSLSFFLNAKTDPNNHHFTKSSEHFEVVFNAKQGNLADQFLLAAEDAYKNLSKYFSYFPSKCILVLDESTDLANGSATVFPYPLIYLYTALPAYNTSITEYHDWIYELVLHEYVHILNLYPQEGASKYIGYIFGSIVRPNMLLPRWHLEGLAVALETKESTGGRLRSDFYRSYSRAIEKEKKWDHFLFSEMNEVSIPSWPFGDRPYFFGSLYWSEILKEDDPTKVSSFVNKNSRRVPYTHDGSMYLANSRRDVEIYTSAQQKYSAMASAEIQKIGQVEQGRNLLDSDDSQQMLLAVSPLNSQLAYVDSSPNRDARIMIFPGEESIATGDSFYSVDWHPIGNKLLYTKLGSFNRYYLVYDLYEYDIDQKKAKRLSNGMRLKEARYSSDGKKIISVQAATSGNKILIGSFPFEKWDPVLEFPLNFRIQNPHFLSDSKILYLKKDSSGQQGIFSYDLVKKEESSVLGFLNQVLYLNKTSSHFYFIGSQTGRSKIYQLNENLNEYKTLQDTQTKILDFAVDEKNKKIYYSELSTQGFQLKIREKSIFSGPEKKLGIYQAMPYSKAYQSSTYTKPANSEAKEYSSWSYMVPKYWFPSVYSSEQSTFYQASTSASDPLLKQSYTLEASYETLTKKINLNLVYINQMNSFDWLLMSNRYSQEFPDSNESVESTSHTLGIQNFLPGLSNDWKLLSLLSTEKSDSTSTSSTGRSNAQIGINYDSRSGLKGKQLGFTEGSLWSFSTKNYFSKEDLKAFQVFRTHYDTNFTKFLPRYHNLRWNLLADKRSTNTNDLFPGYLTAGSYNAALSNSTYHLVRGYALNTFVAWSMVSTNLEYSFPIKFLYKKLFVNPVFLRKLYGKLTFDSMVMDGKYYDWDNATYARDQWKNRYHSVGLELVVSTNLGYFIPVELSLGVHYGTNKQAKGSNYTSLLLSIPNL